jgi:hypothetical protein
MSTDPTVRNGIIDQAQQQRMAKDTVILQKVNYAHREAFKTRFPGQIEHCMRLVSERLHKMLLNVPTDQSNPETWTSTTSELRDMAETLHKLAELQRNFPVVEE